MNTKQIGSITELKILSHLMEKGYNVSLPYGDNCRYDLVVDINSKFLRIQCKTGRLQNRYISFNARSSYTHRGRGLRNYHGQADYFGVYCLETKQCYFVPVVDCSKTICRLRVLPSKNNQRKKVRWAKDYCGIA